MKVGELIEKLKQFEPDMQVALADWNEDYAPPTIYWGDNVKIGMANNIDWDEELEAVVLGDY